MLLNRDASQFYKHYYQEVHDKAVKNMCAIKAAVVVDKFSPMLSSSIWKSGPPAGG